MSLIEVEATSPFAQYDLVCGSKVEGKIYDKVLVRELDGRDEEQLAARGLSGRAKITRMMAGCLVGLVGKDGNVLNLEKLPIDDSKGEDGKIHHGRVRMVREMVKCDQDSLIIAIRRASLGDTMPFATRCPACSAEMKKTIDLSTLQLKKAKDPEGRSYKVTLAGGRVATMRYMTGEDAEKIVTEDPGQQLTAALLVRIIDIDGKPASAEEVRLMKWRDRTKIRNEISANEGSVETDFDVKCDSCKETFTESIAVGTMEFLFPLE